MKNQLPINSLLPQIQETLASGNRAILQAPPGAGKTTAVPLALMESSWTKGGKIVVLEPRRIAARNAAYWMAHLLGEKVGDRVGYSVHLDRKVSKRTVIEVVTEGVMINRLLADPALSDTAGVILDEFHERSLEGDLTLALLTESQEILREDLRLLVMSATLDTKDVADYLGDCPVLTSEGRSYPVEVRYRPSGDKPLTPAVVSCIRLALDREEGSLLVFLPGVGEIKGVQRALEGTLPPHVSLAPLYGALSREDQEKAIEPPPAGESKVVLATSIAESSITIKGIRVVIDSGLIRKPRFNPRSGMDSLETLMVSLASADQRTGRAGRTAPGVCYRLWDQALGLEPFGEPSIIQEDLASLALTLACWGYSDYKDLKWLTPPRPGAFQQARRLLEDLGAVNSTGLTPKGKRLTKLPLHPRLGALVLEGESLGVGPLAGEIAALLSERDILNYQWDQFQADLTYRIEALRGKAVFGAQIHRGAVSRVREVAASISRGQKAAEWQIPPSLLMAAYPDRIARHLGKGRYQLAAGTEVLLNEGDSLGGQPFLVVPSLGGTGRVPRIFSALAVTEEDIYQACGENLHWVEKHEFDKSKGRVRGWKELRLGHICLKEQGLSALEPQKVQQAVYGYLAAEGLKELPWNKDSRRFQERMAFLHRWDPRFPNLSQEGLASDLSWLEPYLGGMGTKSSLQEIPLLQALKGLFDWKSLQEAEGLVPTHFTVPSGSRIPLDYSEGTPVLKVRLQELFGLTETPGVCQGKVPITVHLLSPASRVIQITKDLKSFWDNTYLEVKKDLMGRYPKHYWPENPYEAQPTNRVKKRM